MKKRILSILFVLISLCGFSQNIWTKDYSDYKFKVYELLLKNSISTYTFDTIRVRNSQVGDVLKFSNGKYINSQETDPLYTSDSSYIKSSIRDFAADSSRWNAKQDALTNPVTSPNIGVNGYIPHYSGATTIDTTAWRINGRNLGYGILPTSTFQIEGLGQTTPLMTISNDKNSTKDSTFTILTNGMVGIGTTNPGGLLHLSQDGLLRPIFQNASDVSAYRPILDFQRSRGTIATKTAVQYGDLLGDFYFRGYDGANSIESANFGSIIDNTVSTGLVPAAIYFSTRNVAGGNPLERMRITSSGNVGIGTSAPTCKLDIGTFSADALGNYTCFTKSRNATVESHTILKDNDIIGGIRFKPSDGTDFGTISAEIVSSVDDASPGASSIGGDLVFKTAKGVGADDLTTAMTIDNAQKATFTSSIYYVGTYAGIYVLDASTAQAIATGTTYTKSTAFTTNGSSSNCTADAANDKITITKTGHYLVNCPVSFSGGTSNVNWKMAAFWNNVEQSQIHVQRKIGTGGDVGSATITGILNVTSVPTDLDVRFRHDQAGSENITVVYSNLTVTYIGE